MNNEALNYWNENIENAVVSKEVFLDRVSKWVDFESALTEFFIDFSQNNDFEEDEIEENDTIENEEEEEEEEEDRDYFDELVGEVEEDWDNLSVFWEQVKAPIWA